MCWCCEDERIPHRPQFPWQDNIIRIAQSYRLTLSFLSGIFCRVPAITTCCELSSFFHLLYGNREESQSWRHCVLKQQQLIWWLESTVFMQLEIPYLAVLQCLLKISWGLNRFFPALLRFWFIFPLWRISCCLKMIYLNGYDNFNCRLAISFL